MPGESAKESPEVSMSRKVLLVPFIAEQDSCEEEEQMKSG